MALFIFFLIFLALTLPAAHLLGWSLSRGRQIRPGHIREAMPSLPSVPPLQGSAARRWDASMDRIEKRLLGMFAQGASQIEATALAAQLGEDPILVEGVLARMREEIPCRMQITRSGKIFHDFAAQDIAALASARRRSWPRRLLLGGLTAFANIGAAWPMLSIAAVAMSALAAMGAGGTEDVMIQAGITGVLTATGIFVATLVSGFIAQLLFTPVISGPRLGDVKAHEKRPQRMMHTRGSSDDQLAQDVFFWSMMDSHYHTRHSHSSWSSGSSSSWSDSSSSSGEGGGLFDFDADDAGEGALILILVVVLLAILAAAFTGIWVWARGIWRAIGRLDDPPSATSPTLWVRTADVIDKWEKYLPTNDLVVRTLHALKRYFDHNRQPDDDLAARTLVLAKKKGGVITGLDLVFHEGFDLNEAHAIGARLTGMLGGHIVIDNEGELAFAFPPSVLDKVVSQSDDDMWAEYISFDASGRPQRRRNQEDRSVPVNLVGLTKGHMLSSDRLVAGTYLMALMMAWLVIPGVGPFALSPLVFLPALALLGAMALATGALDATARYTAKNAAANGIRRDIRRAAFKYLQQSIATKLTTVDFTPLEDHLLELFRPAWSGLERSLIEKEIAGVALDLELEPSTEPGLAGKNAYEIHTLRRRLMEDRVFAQAFDFEQVAFDFESGQSDEVIFDTQVERAEVTAL